MNMLRFTEREVIEYTVAKGFKGEEFETQAWKQRGCLRTDGTFKKLINKLECHFENVTVEGKGKKRVYVLSGEKGVPTARKDNRKGRVMPRKTENVVLTNYVHAILPMLQEKGHLNRTSYKKLGEQLFFGDNKMAVLRGAVRTVFKDFLTEKKIPHVWVYAKWYFEERARKEVEQAVMHLQKENKIVLRDYWVGNFDSLVSDKDNRETTYFKDLDSPLIEEIEQAICEIVEANGFTYSEYKQQLMLPYNSQQLLEAKEEVQKHLKNNFGMNFFYQAIDIQVVEKIPNIVVNHREGQVTFLKKTLALTKQKKLADKHVNAKRISDKFYYLVVMLYVQALGIVVDEIELKQELENIAGSLNEIIRSYAAAEKPRGFIHNKR